MIIKNEGPESVLGIFSGEQRCYRCQTLPGKDNKLKHCKGCTSVQYCSKECQTAAWPFHKQICTSRSALEMPSIYANLGYSTLAEIYATALAWAEAHKLGLFMVANMHIEVHGDGADAALNEGLTVGFQLGPPDVKSDGTPATAFSLNSVGFMAGGMAAYHTSPFAAADRASVLRRFREACPHPDLIGIVPVLLYFQDLDRLQIFMSIPLYRRRGGAGALDDRTTTMLGNLTQMCMEVIDEGIVMRLPPGGGPKMPEFGVIAREGKSLAWAPYPSPTGYPWFVLPHHATDFAAYQRLWPYSSLLTNVSR